MKNSWGTDWADDGYFKIALTEGKEGACNMYKLNTWMINHRDHNTLFFSKAPQWSDFSNDGKLSDSTNMVKMQWENKIWGGGPITDQEFVFGTDKVRSPMLDYINYEIH